MNARRRARVPYGLSRAIAVLLVVVHAGLGAWATIGFLELAFDQVPWSRLSNPLFSRRMLFGQWTLVAAAAAVFIAGYVTRWRRTPVAMACIYGAMAFTCAYQTFFVLTAPSRFRAMAIEYVEYALILTFLFSSSYMRARFQGGSEL